MFQRTKTATVLTAVSAKHASTTSGSGVPEIPLLDKADSQARNCDWLPLQPQYHAARKTIVLCHGIAPPNQF